MCPFWTRQSLNALQEAQGNISQIREKSITFDTKNALVIIKYFIQCLFGLFSFKLTMASIAYQLYFNKINIWEDQI